MDEPVKETIIKGVSCKIHGELTSIFYVKRELAFAAFCPFCVEQILLLPENLTKVIYYASEEKIDE